MSPEVAGLRAPVPPSTAEVVGAVIPGPEAALMAPVGPPPEAAANLAPSIPTTPEAAPPSRLERLAFKVGNLATKAGHIVTGRWFYGKLNTIGSTTPNAVTTPAAQPPSAPPQAAPTATPNITANRVPAQQGGGRHRAAQNRPRLHEGDLRTFLGGFARTLGRVALPAAVLTYAYVSARNGNHMSPDHMQLAHYTPGAGHNYNAHGAETAAAILGGAVVLGGVVHAVRHHRRDQNRQIDARIRQDVTKNRTPGTNGPNDPGGQRARLQALQVESRQEALRRDANMRTGTPRNTTVRRDGRDVAVPGPLIDQRGNPIGNFPGVNIFSAYNPKAPPPEAPQRVPRNRSRYRRPPWWAPASWKNRWIP